MGLEPIIVTGMPRSGTTWLARQLARSPRVALTGREPMNPRGGQYALGGTLSGWARLTCLTSPQRKRLRRAYKGLSPFVYGRYGHNQWMAPLPWTRVIVKDPFAMLSLPAIHGITGARAIVVFRHPAAVLASFRRMGWSPDPRELSRLEELFGGASKVTQAPTSDLALVGRMWTLLHSVMLSDLDCVPGAVVLSHESVARGGDRAICEVLAHLGMRPFTLAGDSRVSSGAAEGRDFEETRLHNFHRDPRVVADEWRVAISAEELGVLEDMTADTLSALHRVEFHVT